MTAANTTPTAPDAEKARLVEEILRPRHPFYDIAAAFSTLSEAGKKQFEEHKAKKDTDRARLMALALPDLQTMRASQIAQVKAQEAACLEAEKRRKAAAEQKEAQKEAAKFYNQASANADFSHWATMDYWTFDEALALLLGKDPRILTRAVMKRELAPEFSLLSLSQTQTQRPKSEFLRRYEDLRNVAERAATMKPAQLRPIDVILWAGQSGVIAPPDGLVKALLARVRRSQPQTPPVTAPKVSTTEISVPPSAPSPTLLKRAALVQRYERTWSTIETDLRHANENGLAARAKGERHGYWSEELAVQWARENGKLVEAGHSIFPVAHSPFGRHADTEG